MPARSIRSAKPWTDRNNSADQHAQSIKTPTELSSVGVSFPEVWCSALGFTRRWIARLPSYTTKVQLSAARPVPIGCLRAPRELT